MHHDIIYIPILYHSFQIPSIIVTCKMRLHTLWVPALQTAPSPHYPSRFTCSQLSQATPLYLTGDGENILAARLLSDPRPSCVASARCSHCVLSRPSSGAYWLLCGGPGNWV